jgi:DNA end-binding protein Ku
VLLLQTMLWPDEIRDVGSIAPPDDIQLRPQELQMAQSYIDALVGDFDPSEYADEYAEALRALVEAKAAGREVAAPSEPAARGGDVIDLMAALEASVAEARKGRSEPAHKAPARKVSMGKAPASKRAPAKSAAKAPAKKAAAKTTTAKATPAKKAATKATTAKKTTTAAKKTAAKKTAARRSA